MNRRPARRGLLLSSLCLVLDLGAGVARADQLHPISRQQKDSIPCRLGCTPFEGYIVVPRRTEAGVQTIARPEAVMSANRLYLPLEAGKTP